MTVLSAKDRTWLENEACTMMPTTQRHFEDPRGLSHSSGNIELLRARNPDLFRDLHELNFADAGTLFSTALIYLLPFLLALSGMAIMYIM